MRSMTGFARSDGTSAGARLHWELRSVNHRYLDVQLRLPEGFRAAESALRARINAALGRGKVDATLSVALDAGAVPALQLDAQRAAELIAHAEALAGKMRNPAPISPAAILRWHGVLEEAEPDPGPLLDAVHAVLDEAVNQLDAARRREGERIAVMLETRCAEIATLVAQVRARLPEVVDAMRQRVAERVAALGVEANRERLEQEIVLLAQKLDVSEELDRLEAHVGEVRAAMAHDRPVGRRLDFLMQELNREANTLASKSADAQTTRAAVDLKVAIEQMREQVQNVE